MSVPYWRLSAFYLFFFASIGIFVPYWTLYLQSLGFNAVEIGELMALVMATKIISPNVWGWIADLTGQRLRIVRFGAVMALVSFIAVFFGHSYLWLALTMISFSFFWNAVLPQFEATTLDHLRDAPHRYSRIRLWGSIGFIVAALSLGPVLDHFGARTVPMLVLISLAGVWLATLWMTDTQAQPVAATGQASLLTVLRQPAVMALFLACFLLQASHGAYYTFYTLYLEEHHYSRAVIGGLWSLGVIAEIAIFLAMPRLLPRWGGRTLLLLSLMFTTLRWLMIAYGAQQPLVLVLAQFLHAASFGIYHAVAIHFIHRYFSGRLHGRGQALYSSLSFGAGGAIGSLVAGHTWAGWRPEAAYLAAALLAALGWLVAWRGVKVAE